MTATIRALVRRNGNPRALARLHSQRWYALAWIEDPEEPDRTSLTRIAYGASWPEAMQQAQVLRTELHDRLMDEVHASRASRRTERTAQLETEQQPVPTVMCAWCFQLGHVLANCPGWRTAVEVTR
ncbi:MULTISPECIES: hypothetical protein [unclassified Leucobacter]|uniref:hypothetical protein n=1 Tax=unclassified Leucobacter TaxID=2621730 RepID=UPI000621C561|nr:hypothetical protein [Leucobacter sp. Ag1]KKI19658.1 hypothetical protein XM48_09340 [Leucobacter sp. Ag1]